MAHVIFSLQGNSVHRRVVTTPFRCPDGLHGRGNVVAFSRRSRSRMLKYLRTCDAEYVVLGTLTYPCGYPTDGEVCKRHLDSLVKRLRRLYPKSRYPGFSLFWWIEFQDRGAPHFHFLCTHRIEKEFLASSWYEICRSDDERHLYAGTRIEWIRSGRRGMSAYVAKYAGKAGQKEIPANFTNIGRFWGIYGLRSTMSAYLVFDVKSEKNSPIRRFLSEFNEEIKNAGPRVKIKRFGAITCIYDFKSDLAIKRIKMLFWRYGTIAEAEGSGYLEYPTRDVPFENEGEGA